MKAIDKRSNAEVQVEITDNGFIVTMEDKTTKNISVATLKRWYKVVDENGNEINVPAPVSVPKVIDNAKASAKAGRAEVTAEEKAAKELAKAEAKATKEAEKLVKEAAKTQAKIAREAAKEAGKAQRASNKTPATPEVPSPVDIHFISEVETTTERSVRTRTFKVKIAVGEVLLEMGDNKNILGRFTMHCVVLNSAGETIYTALKFSAKDCINWLQPQYGWSDEQVAAINRDVRLARKGNINGGPLVLAPIDAEALSEKPADGAQIIA